MQFRLGRVHELQGSRHLGPCTDDCTDQGGIWYEGVCTFASPILIPTGESQAYKLSSAADGVLFDIDGNGLPEQISWPLTGTELAFLALDRDGDGRITSGRELFGNFTVPSVSNGFDALAQVTGVTGDAIEITDAAFSELLL